MESDKEQAIKLHFLEEANTHLSTIESVLLESQINISIHNINNAMRAAHSIKGGAAMMNFDSLSQFAHQLEEVFKVLKIKKQQLDIDTVKPVLLASVDSLRQIIYSYKQSDNNNHLLIEHVRAHFEKLHELFGDAPQENAATILATEENPQEIIPLIFQTQVEDYLQQLESLLHEKDPDSLREELVLMAGELGGLGYMLQIETFTCLCESVINCISTAKTDDEVIEISQLALHNWRQSQVLVLQNQLNSIPSSITLTQQTTPTPARATTATPPTGTRVGAKQLEAINDLSSELTIQRQSLKLKLENLSQLFSHLKNCANSLEKEYRQVSSSSQISKIHFKPLQANITKLQEVINDISFKLTDSEHTNSALNRTAQNLENSLAQILMRPLADILEPFARALYDLSVEYNKPVELKTTGAEIIVERSILDAIQEPLLHILRNAFDHGIEDTQTRRDLGKPEQGLIKITATASQNHIVILVSDDGCGISVDKVKKRAFEIGFDATLLQQATDDELIPLIFEPGFSTREQVTALSGRGVGMDVVRNNINQIGGDVTVSTQPGKGTEFTLSIPFNILIFEVMFIESNSMLFAFSSSSIREVLVLKENQIFCIADKEFLPYHNQNIPLIRLNNLLHFNHPDAQQAFLAKTSTLEAPTILIIDYDNEIIAIQVDRCCGKQETTIRQVEGNIPLPVGFGNCTIIGNGKIVPIINLDELITSQLPLQSEKSINLENVNPENINPENINKKTETKTILVIDDSTNVRNLLVHVLEKAGYQVEEAFDGLNGIEKLQTEVLIKAIICDIDMPRLDGLGFLARVKAQPAFKHIPIIMLTSHTGDRYRNLAFQLGAKAYLSKPYNEYELLTLLSD